MKEKIVLLLLFFLPFVGSLMAQVPISITKDLNINFGTTAASSVAGTVVLSPSGSRTTHIGGIILPSSIGTVSAAQFSVTGEPYHIYEIMLAPANEELSSGVAGATMTISDFQITTFNNTGSLSATGRDTVFVGATLNVGASQATGSYTSIVGFQVLVNYP